MGALTLPASGLVYVDTMILIYSVERFPSDWPLIEPLWQSAQSGSIEIVSSELALMEVLVGPLKSGNITLEKAFEQAPWERRCGYSLLRNRSCEKLPDYAQLPS